MLPLNCPGGIPHLTHLLYIHKVRLDAFVLWPDIPQDGGQAGEATAYRRR